MIKNNNKSRKLLRKTDFCKSEIGWKYRCIQIIFLEHHTFLKFGFFKTHLKIINFNVFTQITSCHNEVLNIQLLYFSHAYFLYALYSFMLALIPQIHCL